MQSDGKKIGLCAGRGYIPGVNIILKSVYLAARERGASVIGIRDGFDGILFSGDYADGGTVPLTGELVEILDIAGNLLGAGARRDPFRLQSISAQGMVEEIDRSDELIEKIRDLGLAALIVIGGHQTMSTLLKLSRKGLPVVCIPVSAENEIAATQLSFGFNTALNFTADMLDRASHAALAAGKIGVVEVLGAESGWLALQSALTACADAVLIPEFPYKPESLAQHLEKKLCGGSRHGLVVVAEGASVVPLAQPAQACAGPMRRSLAPLAQEGEGRFVIDRTGSAAETVCRSLQKLLRHETYPLALGSWSKGGSLTAVDKQLGMAYGVAAVRAALQGSTGTMVAFEPPDIDFIPIEQVINRVRCVPRDSIFLSTADALGIYTGGR